jgi:hypothetical protein
VPPLVFLGGCKRLPLAAGATLLAALALSNGYDICRGTRWSLISLRAYRERSTALALSLARPIPQGAWVYSSTQDKMLWPYWHVGTLAEPRPTAKSMARAFEAGLNVFAFEPKLKPRDYLGLERALQQQGLSFAKLRPRGLLHVIRKPEAQP